MPKIIKYDSTIGLLVNHPSLKKPILAKVWFSIKDNDTVSVCVENSNTGDNVRGIGVKVISLQEWKDIERDPHDDVGYARRCFKFMGCTLAGDAND